ncbi:hypothetical protein G6F70_007725 [Rhizopus microsporus]|nr:hypothetical protein G6F71_007829 [Rhizopus microsporus]KAG1196079.1 hypothetical protein G6F70_007725 [Rhizopus microsporus]KAG1207753.1 hypothetical protein G6F69_007784 [Rhizopus microsporus]KAG1228278.1 hypothetical protein G6F67_007926 [Rhizopus microsporus]KAG1269591.1 hypothetical protein G6F68_000116 [Rhizopus microsporus]
MSSNIKYIQEHHKNFNVLSFAKHTKAKSLSSFKKELDTALSAIADQDIKKNRDNRDIISWARLKRKNQNELTGTVQIKKYFYKIVRENYISTKKYLKLIKKLRDTEEEINQIEDGEPSAQAEDDDDDDDEDTSDLIKSFRNLDHSNKWILSTGKCVDNELFLFALQCQEDHPSKQFIMDVADLNYVQYDVFTEEELDEISTFEEKELPMPPDAILQHMNHFNLTSANQLRTALNNNHTFYNNPDKDIDWINHTIYSLVREYESGNMKRTHSETWYQTHIWRMIETCFDKLDELEAAIGEPISMANQNRMNNKRTIDGFNTIARVKLGHKCDSVFRTCRIDHSKDQEFGATEAKAKYNISSEHFKDSFVKLPTTLKDMLDDLIKTKPSMYKCLQTVGFIHSGLSSTMLNVDRPTRNITRVTRQEPIVISHAIEHFGETVLPAMVSVWIATDIVKSTFDILNVLPPPANAKIIW